MSELSKNYDQLILRLQALPDQPEPADAEDKGEKGRKGQGGGRGGVREGLMEEEKEASMAPASYSLRPDSIDVHFLYVSWMCIQSIYI